MAHISWKMHFIWKTTYIYVYEKERKAEKEDFY